MPNYYFTDVSHWQGELNVQPFADAGHRFMVAKASDNYHMRDKNGDYDIPADRHWDCRFVDNFMNARKIGLSTGAYHFCRWDRPRGTKLEIVNANLQYFQEAVAMLPEEHRGLKTAILDMEQHGEQIVDAGLSKADMNEMAKDMVTLFLENYENVIVYSGSWWTDQYWTNDTSLWMKERVAYWEAHYTSIANNMPVNPDFKPSLPYGWMHNYATTTDIVGKLFAWQFTSSGRFGASNTDVNQFRMPKEEVYKLFNEGAVDPPPPPDGCELLGTVRDWLLKGVNWIDERCI